MSVNTQYTNRLQFILNNGSLSNDRTGTGTIRTSICPEMVFDLRDGFPLLSWKKTSFHNIQKELEWFLSGDTSLKPLLDNGVNIWNGNAFDWFQKNSKYAAHQKELNTIEKFIQAVKDEQIEFDLGRVYGAQWRNWKTTNGEVVDQFKNIVEALKQDSTSRKLVMTAWNVGELKEMALEPCHCLVQFFTSGQYVDCNLYQRSADFGLGVPYNIASYALLLEMVANMTGKVARFFKHSFGDAHIYLNHVKPLKEALKEERIDFPMPKLELVDGNFMLLDYKFNSFIKLKMSV